MIDIESAIKRETLRQRRINTLVVIVLIVSFSLGWLIGELW